MQYIYFKTKDNAEGNLDSNISAVALTVPLESGDGANFPAIYRGTTTSGGTSTTMNKTGIGASGIAVGDAIENITDGSHCYVTGVAADSLTTSELQGGSDNTWQSGDTYAAGRFVITVNQRDVDTGEITASEMMLVDNRVGDILTINSSGRGYNGSTAQSFDAGDYVNVFVVAAITKEISKAMGEVYTLIDAVYTKAEVDVLLALRSWKDPVVVATTGPVTLATGFENGDTIDGVVLATGDRILVKDQAAGAENGIYTVNASGAPTRTTDFDSTAEAYGSCVQVKKGTANADTVWMLTTDNPTIGVDALNFAQVGASLTKASTGEATAGVEDTHYMTPAKVNDRILAGVIESVSSDYSAVVGNYKKLWTRSDALGTPVLKTVLSHKNGTWSVGGNLAGSRTGAAGFGTQTDAVAAGGNIGSAMLSTTEEYNGTSWAAGGNMSQSKSGLRGAGTGNAGLIFGGIGFNSTTYQSITEEYDGASWAAGGNMSQSKSNAGGCGTQVAALLAGGTLQPGTATLFSRTEAYDGAAWATGGNLSQSKADIGLVGTTTAALATGGGNATISPWSITETYNGSSWSAGSNLPQSRMCHAAFGTAIAAVIVSGVNAGEDSTSIAYNGTSWVAMGNANITSQWGAGAGTQTAGLKAGGGVSRPNSGTVSVSVTEEFDMADVYTVKTITIT